MVQIEKSKEGYCVACGTDSFLTKGRSFYKIRVGVSSLSRITLCSECLDTLERSIKLLKGVNDGKI